MSILQQYLSSTLWFSRQNCRPIVGCSRKRSSLVRALFTLYVIGSATLIQAQEDGSFGPLPKKLIDEIATWVEGQITIPVETIDALSAQFKKENSRITAEQLNRKLRTAKDALVKKTVENFKEQLGEIRVPPSRIQTIETSVRPYFFAVPTDYKGSDSNAPKSRVMLSTSAGTLMAQLAINTAPRDLSWEHWEIQKSENRASKVIELAEKDKKNMLAAIFGALMLGFCWLLITIKKWQAKAIDIVKIVIGALAGFFLKP